MLAKAQWQGLHKTLTSLDGEGRAGAAATEIARHRCSLPTPGSPSARNLSLVISAIRNGPVKRLYFARWMEERGYEILRLPENLYFEGEGDALFGGDALFCGYKFRSDIQFASRGRGHARLPRHLRRAGRPALLPSRHLLLSAAGWQCGFWFPAAFDEYGQRAIRAHVAGVDRRRRRRSRTFFLQRRRARARHRAAGRRAKSR